MLATLTVMFLSTYNTVSNFVDLTSRVTKKVYRSFYNLFVPDTYVFFHDIDYPYPAMSVNTNASASAKPAWRYLSETFQFVAWSLNGQLHNAAMTHQLDILSMELVEDDNVLYDLSDFIEKIRVYNDVLIPLSPSVSQIVHAWMLASGIVLDPSRDFRVRYMTSDAETVTRPFIADNIETEDIDAEQVLEQAVEQAVDEQALEEQAVEQAVEEAVEAVEQVEETPQESTDVNKMD